MAMAKKRDGRLTRRVALVQVGKHGKGHGKLRERRLRLFS